ncbi:MAG: GDSL family lipase [Bacteroidales bacterium]|nr:GDSL family lipase [Candidatus Cryptobacteroides aphodequi]
MKHLLTIIATLATCSLLCSARETAAGDDGRIFIEGRTLTEDGKVSFDWSGVTLRIRFCGTSLEMAYSDSGHDWMNVWVDETPSAKEQKKIELKGEGSITLASGLRKGEHEVVLQKRTEGEQGRISISGFDTDGKFLKASDPFRRHIEFIGDSYTCGYGTEAANRNCPFKAEEENCNLTYAAIIGRHFDAGVRHISHSGRGIARNYGDAPDALMPERYTRTFDCSEKEGWKAGSDGFKPDVVVIYLGTNDFSTGKQPSLGAWCQQYTTLLEQIASNYGSDIPVLCAASNCDELLADYVKEAARSCGLKNVRWTAVNKGAHDIEGDLGASWHPNYKGQRKVAACMIPYIATLTGWDMPFKAIE